MTSNIVEYACNPDVFDGATKIQVTLVKKRCNIKPRVAVLPLARKIAYTIGEQVDEALYEWYLALGQPVPADEVGIGAKMDIANAEAEAEAEAALNKAQAVSEKPEFGTSAFWAWARAQKAQKNKELAEQGLPPLPTKKEKEAAKAVKAAERAAKKTAKATKTK